MFRQFVEPVRTCADPVRDQYAPECGDHSKDSTRRPLEGKLFGSVQSIRHIPVCAATRRAISKPILYTQVFQALLFGNKVRIRRLQQVAAE